MPETVVLVAVLAVALVVLRWHRRRRADGSGSDVMTADSGYRVLVAVAHPSSAEGLGRLAAMIARADRGQVEALIVVDEWAAVEFRSMADHTVTRCSSAAIDAGVESTERVRVDNDVGRGILHRCVELDASLVVLGWPDVGEAGCGPDVQTAVSVSPSPLVVARLQGYRWQRVRMCVPSQVTDAGMRASVRLATEIGTRIGHAADVPIVEGRPGGSARADRASELRVMAVAPDREAVRQAVAAVEPLGDLVLALCHGPRARDHRPLLASAERLYDTATSSPVNR